MFRSKCNREAFLGSLWIQQLMLVWSFPFFLTVQDALISARFDMSNRHHHSLYTAPCQSDWFIGRAQAAERAGGGAGGGWSRGANGDMKWNRDGGTANCGPFRNLWCIRAHYQCKCAKLGFKEHTGQSFHPFLEREKDPPCYLSPHPLIFGNQPLIRGNLQMHVQNQKRLPRVL